MAHVGWQHATMSVGVPVLLLRSHGSLLQSAAAADELRYSRLRTELFGGETRTKVPRHRAEAANLKREEGEEERHGKRYEPLLGY